MCSQLKMYVNVAALSVRRLTEEVYKETEHDALLENTKNPLNSETSKGELPCSEGPL